jgi:hypothetical protein
VLMPTGRLMPIAAAPVPCKNLRRLSMSLCADAMRLELLDSHSHVMLLSYLDGTRLILVELHVSNGMHIAKVVGTVGIAFVHE